MMDLDALYALYKAGLRLTMPQSLDDTWRSAMSVHLAVRARKIERGQCHYVLAPGYSIRKVTSDE